MFGRFSFFLLVSALSLGCNSAFRSNYTAIRITAPVAEYLSKQTVNIHNNSSNPTVRQVEIVQQSPDSLYQIQFKKLAGQSLILEVEDTAGRIRNVAIPQTKLRAFPFLLSTTTAPTLSSMIIATRNPNVRLSRNLTDVLATTSYIAAMGIDAIAYPIVKAASKNKPYAVPRTFVIRDLRQVYTFDSSNKKSIYRVVAPVNKVVSPFLDADFQKRHLLILGSTAGFGLVNEYYNSNADIGLKQSPWYAIEYNVQGSPYLRWGLHHTWSQHKDFQAGITSMQAAYVHNNANNGRFIFGIGVGSGGFIRYTADNRTDSTRMYKNRTLGPDSMVIKTATFIPDNKYFFLPMSGFIKYEQVLFKQINLNLGINVTQVRSHTDYSVQDALRTTENIAPGVTASRTHVYGYPTIERHKAKNLLIQFNFGINIQLNR